MSEPAQDTDAEGVFQGPPAPAEKGEFATLNAFLKKLKDTKPAEPQGARGDVCHNARNPTGHCFKEGGCKDAAECRVEVDRFIDPEG